MSKTENFLSKQITFKIEKETKEALKAIAKDKGFSLSFYLRELIRRNVSQNQTILP